MDTDGLVAGAAGDSVTSDRLSEAVVDALEADEQPHHLLVGSSIDYATGSTSERVYAAIDATATAVATDRRVVFVVPESVATRVESISYEAITGVETSFENPRELRVEAPTATIEFYPSEGEDPTPVGDFLASRARRDDGDERASAPGADADADADADVDARTDPDADLDVDAGTVTSDGGRSAGGRTTATGADADFRRGGAAGAAGTGGEAAPASDRDADAGSADGDGADDADGERDPLDTLERLAALNERGVIDDEEFARKKAELLDEI